MLTVLSAIATALLIPIPASASSAETPAFTKVPDTATSLTWEEQAHNSGPPGDVGGSAAYDASNGTVVFFGGYENGGYLGGTWTWNGTTWTEVATTGPSPREAAAMAYDPETGDIVLFGGSGSVTDQSPTGYLNDTWIWNGTTWDELYPTGDLPGARAGASITYDAATDNVVMFGGYFNGNPEYGDTWTWNGTSWNDASDSGPGIRAGAAMAFDPTTNNVVLFGGYYSNAQGNLSIFGDTWSWNGSDWTELSPFISAPSRAGASMAFDVDTSQMVLFGGWGGASNGDDLNDTWIWTDGTWTQQNPEVVPPARSEAQIVYDGSIGYLVLFGGNENGTYSDTWNWGYQPLTVVTTSLPGGQAGQWYHKKLQAIGGIAPYKWKLVSQLPLGLSLSRSGFISGVPYSGLKHGDYEFSFDVTDSTTPYKLSVTETMDIEIK